MRVLSFFTDNLPSLSLVFYGGPIFFLWIWFSLWFAGSMKKRGMPTGFTRKIFHFLIFTSVVLLQWLLGTPAVLVFGVICSLLVFYAVYRGAGHPFYEALAREKDSPLRSWLVILPWLTTLLGGVFTNLCFGSLAIAGYLVTGFGDAIGEPVGTLFGRHPYRVLSFSRVKAIRTLEGSAAVFLASLLALVITALILPQFREVPGWFLIMTGIAGVVTLVEAATPHGWDNFTMQVVPVLLLNLWLQG